MTTDTVGGVWNYSVELCRALARHGVHVALATMGGPLSRDQRGQIGTLDNVDVHEGAFRLEWMDDPWDDVQRAGDWLLDIESAARPDVIHLNGYTHGALPWSAPVLMVGHSCVLSWWRAVHGADAPAQWDRYRDSVRNGLHAAQLVATPTRAMLNALIEHYGPLPHGVVVPNGCELADDPGLHDASGLPHPESTLATIDGSRPVVLAAGRTWDESKNMQSLARAAAAIHGDVCVAGSDLHPGHGRVTLDGVRTLGMLPPPALRQWYRRASVFVHPALYEPFGLAPLEAALEGCALVLGDIPSLREVWGDAAEYVSPGDSGAIADAVNALLDCPDRLHAGAEAAARRARTYTGARMAEMYDVAYRTLAARAAVLKGAVACV